MAIVQYKEGQGPIGVSPASVFKWAVVTPDDLTTFDLCRCLYIGVAGDVQIEDGDGNAITFANCPVGILPVMAVRLMDETTAGSVLAGY